jgi:glycosyltransferase involved in cell wall biosynthesis
VPAPASPGVARVALVVGTTTGGTGAHVRMLAAGLAERGIGVSVLGPSSADARFSFSALAGVQFSPVEVSDRPRLGDAAAVLRLRRLLGSRADPAGRLDAAHAHGLRAGALAVLALGGAHGRGRRLRRGRGSGRNRPALVVTVHNAPPSGGVARRLVYRLLERLVARRADLVLCVSPDLEARMRAAGASRVGRAIVPAPESPAGATVSPAAPQAGDVGAGDRPVVLAVGRLAAQKDFGTLIEAVARWRDLDPPPLLAIAGDGPLAGELRAQAAALGVDAVFLGHRGDVPELLKAATVFALPSRWEGQPLILSEALRAGAAIVATRVGGVPDLVGDAAMLVSPADPAALAAPIGAILRDRALALRLRAAATRRARHLPTADDAVTAVLAAYAEAIVRLSAA